MSHFSHIKTQMVEKEYLLQALRDLGYAVEEGDLSIGGFGRQKANVEIRVQTKGYAVGFDRTAGGYQLVGDWFGVKGISRTRFLREVTQRYAYNATRARLEEQGFALVDEDRQADGRIHLVLRRAI